MRKVLLGTGSPLWPSACDLELEGALEVHLVRKGTTKLPASPGDQILLGTTAPLWIAKPLLLRAQEGLLGDLRVVVDGPADDLRRLGWRWRPYLRAIHDLGRVALPEILPAPVVRSRDLHDLLTQWEPPRVGPAEVPSDFPLRLQLQTTTACRARCPFCPHPGPDAPEQQMDDALFDRILAQCAVGQPDIIELYLQAEPLLDPRLEELASRARAAVPDALVTVVTEEHALTEERAASLAAVMPVVFVSVNAPEGRGGGLVRRLERVARLAEPFVAAGGQLVVTTLEDLLPAGTRRVFRKECTRLGLPIESFRATSRLGAVDVEPLRRPGATHPGLGVYCDRPFTTAVVHADGDIGVCCEDWEARRSLGHADDLAGAWSGPAWRALRRGILTGAPLDPCSTCEILAPPEFDDPTEDTDG